MTSGSFALRAPVPSFLPGGSQLLYPVYAAACLALAAWGAAPVRQAPADQHGDLLVVTLGVFYDNLILAAGGLLGEGQLLLGPSIPRWLDAAARRDADA